MSAQQSGEKTEKATPKRKREAREKGQVFKSVEVISAFSLIVMFGVLKIFGGGIAGNITHMMTSFFSGDMPDTVNASTAAGVLGSAIVSFLKIVAPVLIAAMLCGIVFNLVQVGFNFTAKALAPKAEKISMISGFKRIFSKRTLIDLVKALIKIGLLGWVAYSEYQKRIVSFPPLMGQNLAYAIPAALDVVLGVAFKLAIAFAIFAPLDYIYQRWKHNKDGYRRSSGK
jgi:flagellar biosynthetic protein FlhB